MSIKRLISTIVVLFSMSSASVWACELPAPTKINVTPIMSDVIYDHSQSLRDIQSQAKIAHNPYGFAQHTYTQGFMNGSITMKPIVKLGGYTNPKKSTACLWFDSISVTIEVDPKIIIAREVYKDSCLRKAVYTHEMKHVHVDRKIVDEFAERLKKALQQNLQEKGAHKGLTSIKQKKSIVKAMQQSIFTLARQEYSWMAEERARAQEGIDTVEEYDRVHAICPAQQRSLGRYYRR